MRLLAILTVVLTGAGVAALMAGGPAPAPTPLIVHEWGTFTSYQDEAGRAIGGINTDDEPVPDFVHRVHTGIQPDSYLTPIFNKGLPGCDPAVTMRLETPVLYFHRAAGAERKADVDVSFRGGWLTEFYPNAAADAPELGNVTGKGLTGATVGSLSWHGLKVGVPGQGPATDDVVWKTPRNVQSDGVATTEGESERFLFYRGVGHLDSPLSVWREASKGGRGAGELAIHEQLQMPMKDSWNALPMPVWLVDVRADGMVAWRRVKIDRSSGVMASTPADFAENDYGPAKLPGLQKEMTNALKESGLFADEAAALLNTWELSYFKSAGLRLFFITPGFWTDHYLPLRVSGGASITRVMVGRIELVTPRQRELLRTIESSPVSQPLTTPLTGATPKLEDFPPAYQAYMQIGRFRNALILDEQARHPDKTLETFIKVYGLQGPTPPPLPQIPGL